MCVLYVSFFYYTNGTTTYYLLCALLLYARIQPYINTIRQSIQCLCALSCWPQITSLRLSHKKFQT